MQCLRESAVRQVLDQAQARLALEEDILCVLSGGKERGRKEVTGVLEGDLDGATFGHFRTGWEEEVVMPDRVLDLSLRKRRAHRDEEACDRWPQSPLGEILEPGNVSELHLVIGDIEKALSYAERARDLADRSGDDFRRMVMRTTLADALFPAGRLFEARALFEEAEAIQRELQLEYPLLYSLRGFQYCDLLLGQGAYEEVRKRAKQTLEWGRQQYPLLTIGLDHLALGRAYLLEAETPRSGDFSQAAEYLNRAVDGLRKAGEQGFIPRGRIARAALHRVCQTFGLARRDLHEAMAIAKRSGMGLFEADAHLEYARFSLAMGENAKAREALSTAKGMIEKMGYHRRDTEVAALEGMLKGPS